MYKYAYIHTNGVDFEFTRGARRHASSTPKLARAPCAVPVHITCAASATSHCYTDDRKKKRRASKRDPEPRSPSIYYYCCITGRPSSCITTQKIFDVPQQVGHRWHVSILGPHHALALAVHQALPTLNRERERTSSKSKREIIDYERKEREMESERMKARESSPSIEFIYLRLRERQRELSTQLTHLRKLGFCQWHWKNSRGLYETRGSRVSYTASGFSTKYIRRFCKCIIFQHTITKQHQ
ncbi:unnamed protein product [Trichogramma brassicae]|uniref:Uncharacterized protein n=1 Tax=Trichogramma brassicae TaxID=86971 RepID=A0A6H5IPG4_9HYME|nr:unnamed protein product [Trichogramma brassicae]